MLSPPFPPPPPSPSLAFTCTSAAENSCDRCVDIDVRSRVSSSSSSGGKKEAQRKPWRSFQFPRLRSAFCFYKGTGQPRSSTERKGMVYVYVRIYIFIQRFKEIKRDWSYAQCYTACVCVCVQADVSRCFYVVKCCSPFPLFVGYCYEGRDGCGKKQFACNISRFLF